MPAWGWVALAAFWIAVIAGLDWLATGWPLG